MRKKVLMGLGLLLCLLYGTSPVYGFWQEKIDSETRIHKLSFRSAVGWWSIRNWWILWNLNRTIPPKKP